MGQRLTQRKSSHIRSGLPFCSLLMFLSAGRDASRKCKAESSLLNNHGTHGTSSSWNFLCAFWLVNFIFDNLIGQYCATDFWNCSINPGVKNQSYLFFKLINQSKTYIWIYPNPQWVRYLPQFCQYTPGCYFTRASRKVVKARVAVRDNPHVNFCHAFVFPLRFVCHSGPSEQKLQRHMSRE